MASSHSSRSPKAWTRSATSSPTWPSGRQSATCGRCRRPCFGPGRSGPTAQNPPGWASRPKPPEPRPRGAPMTTTYTPVVDDADRALLVDTVRSFVANEIKPKVVDLDASERFPDEIYRQLGELGLFGVTLPVEHFGAGGSVRDYIAVMEELAYGYASIADQAGLAELL